MEEKRAEAILAQLRPKFPSLTDLEIASKKEKTASWIINIIGFTAILLITTRMLPGSALAVTAILAFAAMTYFGIQRYRFTRIRKLLENPHPPTLPTDH
ncbi:MAG: hypothetical protein QM627_07765 [Luteolibacter sp.]